MRFVWQLLIRALHTHTHTLQPGLQKGSWSKEEDHIVKTMVMDMGVAKVKWSYVAEHVSPSCLGGRNMVASLTALVLLSCSCRGASASSAGNAGSTTWTHPSRRATGRGTRT